MNFAALGRTALTLLIGGLGAAVAWSTGFPAPFLTGPALAVTIASLGGLKLDVANWFRNGMFVVLGTTIGQTVTPDVLSAAIRWPLSFACLFVMLLVIIVVCRAFLMRRWGFDRTTALMGAFPGHLSYVLGLSEGIRAAADEQGIALQRAIGGEDDSPSRSLAKAIERVSTAAPRRLEVLAIRRPDRFRRGGDHIPFLKRGYPAVRFSEVAEHYDYQHQDLRTENGREYGDTIDKMDFDYLARVTALNMDVIRELASAPAAPATVEIEGAVSADTTVNWTPVKGAAGYRVHWRPANEMAWAEAIDLPAGQTETVLKGVIIDNNFFGVSALSDSGAESVVTFAGMPGGSGANGAAE